VYRAAAALTMIAHAQAWLTLYPPTVLVLASSAIEYPGPNVEAPNDHYNITTAV
jgi:hypothetical protein